MENAAIVAIAKAIKEKMLKEASKELEPGHYDLDFMIRFLGGMNKGEDFEQRLPNKINAWLAFALALSKVNAETRKTIIDSVVQAHSNGKESDEHKKLVDQIKGEVMALLDEIKGTTVTTMTGKVTTDLSFEMVGLGKVAKVG
jgi:hypothetical protein